MDNNSMGRRLRSWMVDAGMTAEQLDERSARDDAGPRLRGVRRVRQGPRRARVPRGLGKEKAAPSDMTLGGPT